MSLYPGGRPAPPVPIPARPVNWLGTTALAVAIVGLVLCWSIFGGLVCGVIAIIVGVTARGRVRRGEATNGTVATSGIALGTLAVIVSLAVVPVWVRIYRDVDVPAYVDCVSETSDQPGAKKCADELRQRLEQELGGTAAANA